MKKLKKTLEEIMPKGTCFICGNPCMLTSYCHEHCAISYHEEKQKKIKEALKESGN